MEKDLISEIGFLKFVQEFKKLSQIEKPYWVNEKKVAAEHGDRSENAEYISAKEMLRNLDKRLRFLEKIINNSKVVETSTLLHTKINFSSSVSLLNLESNEIKEFAILGTHEIDPSLGIISNKSPFGKALLQRSLNEEFEFLINGELSEYRVLSIKAYIFKT